MPPQPKCDPSLRAHPQGGRGDRDGLELLETTGQCSRPQACTLFMPRNPAPTFPKDASSSGLLSTPAACSPRSHRWLPGGRAEAQVRQATRPSRASRPEGLGPARLHRLSAPAQPVFKRSRPLYVLVQIKGKAFRFHLAVLPLQPQAASRVRAEAASSPRWPLGRGRAHKGGGRAASSGPPALLRARGAGSAPRTMPSRETQRYRLPCPAGAEVPLPARPGGCLCARRHRAKARRGHLRSDRCWSSVASGRVTRPCHFHLQSPPTPDTHVTVTAQLTTRLSRTRDGNPAVPALARGTRGVRGASGAERCRVGRGGDRGCPPRRAVRRQPCSRPFLPAASVLERARRHREAPQARGLSPASPTSALQGHADA